MGGLDGGEDRGTYEDAGQEDEEGGEEEGESGHCGWWCGLAWRRWV